MLFNNNNKKKIINLFINTEYRIIFLKTEILII